MKDDKALEVLKSVREKIDAAFPNDLVVKCYDIEKQHLVEKDRQKPMDMIKTLVEDYVESEGH